MHESHQTVFFRKGFQTHPGPAQHNIINAAQELQKISLLSSLRMLKERQVLNFAYNGRNERKQQMFFRKWEKEINHSHLLPPEYKVGMP